MKRIAGVLVSAVLILGSTCLPASASTTAATVTHPGFNLCLIFPRLCKG